MDSYIPRRAIIILRESINDPNGVANQLTRLRKKADSLGWATGPDATHVINENDTSASKRKVKYSIPGSSRYEHRTKRPGLRRALDMLADGRADGLLADDIDRIARDPRDGEDLIEVVEMAAEQDRAIPTASLSSNIDLSTADGRFLFRILVGKARKEAEDIGRRSKNGHKARADKGRPHMGIYRLFGYERAFSPEGEPTLAIVESEAAWIRRAVEGIRQGTGRTGLSGLVREMNEAGVTSTAGMPFNSESLRVVLENPRIAGLQRDRKTLGNWPAIIPEPEWREMMGILDRTRRPRHAPPPGPSVRRIGSRFYRCGAPGCNETVVTNGRREAPKYVCRNGDLARPADKVDDVVVSKVTEWLATEDSRILLRKPPTDGSEEHALSEEAAKLRREYDELIWFWDNGDITASELHERRKVRADRLAEIEEELNILRQPDIYHGLAGEENAAEIWEQLTPEIRRMILHDLVEVTILPAGPGRHVFDASKIVVKFIRPGDSREEVRENPARKGPKVLVCQWSGCGRKFQLKFPEYHHRKYCSPECREAAWEASGGKEGQIARRNARKEASL